MKILSFDCGVKTLAWIYFETNYNIDSFNILNQQLDVAANNIDDFKDWATRFHKSLSNIINIINCGVISLGDIKAIMSKKHICVKKLHGLLTQLPTDANVIFVERQMPPGYNNIFIEACILMFYGNKNIFEVGPSFKNLCCIGDNGKYQNFISKYNSSHYANKKHIEYNFLAFLKLYNIKLNLKKCDINHIGDAFFQSITQNMIDV